MRKMLKEVGGQTRQADFFNVCGSCSISCCRDARPPLTSRRMARIRDYLKAEGITIENPFVKNVYWFPRVTEDNCCVFLNKSTNKCIIHPVKPETCVAGPFTFDINVKTRRIEWFLKTERICPLAGALYRDKRALNGHLECARKELLELIHELDAEALRAVLKIEETDTFKIGEEDLDTKVLTKAKICGLAN